MATNYCKNPNLYDNKQGWTAVNCTLTATSEGGRVRVNDSTGTTRAVEYRIGPDDNGMSFPNARTAVLQGIMVRRDHVDTLKVIVRVATIGGDSEDFDVDLTKYAVGEWVTLPNIVTDTTSTVNRVLVAIYCHDHRAWFTFRHAHVYRSFEAPASATPNADWTQSVAYLKVSVTEKVTGAWNILRLDWGDGTATTDVVDMGQAVTHTYATAGTKTITGTVYNTVDGVSTSYDTSQKQVTVAANPSGTAPAPLPPPAEATDPVPVFERFHDRLRLEVVDPSEIPAGTHPNMIQNHSGDQGAWGWETPVPGSFLEGTTNEYTRGVQGLLFHAATGAVNYFYTEPVPITEGGYVDAGWELLYVGNQYRTRFEFLDEAGAVVRSSVEQTQPNTPGWHQANISVNDPAAAVGAVSVRLRFNCYADTSGTPYLAEGWKLALRRVMVVIFEDPAEGTPLAMTNPNITSDTTGWTVFNPPMGGGTASLTAGAEGGRLLGSGLPTAGSFLVGGGITPAYVGTAIARFRYRRNTTGVLRLEWGAADVVMNAPVGVWTDVEVAEFDGHSGEWFYFQNEPGSTSVDYTLTGFSATPVASGELTFSDSTAWRNILGPTHEITTGRAALDAGSLSATILDVTLDPALSPSIRPGNRVRLQAWDTDAAQWSPMFTGLIDEGQVTYEPSYGDGDPKAARIVITATDNTQRLANAVRPEGVEKISDLPYVLEGAGVPWVVNDDSSQLAADPLVVAYNDNASALDQVAVTRDTAQGYAWVDGSGTFRAYDPDVMPAGVVGVLDESAYSTVDVAFDTKACINEVTVTFLRYKPVSGDTEEVTYGPYRDQDSINTWGRYSADFTIQGEVEDEALISGYAAGVLAANATPVRSISEVTVPVRDESELVRGRALLDLYDLVTVSYAATGTVHDKRVESVEHTITPESWVMRLGFAGDGSVASPRQVPAPRASTATSTPPPPTEEPTLQLTPTMAVAGHAFFIKQVAPGVVAASGYLDVDDTDTTRRDTGMVIPEGMRPTAELIVAFPQYGGTGQYRYFFQPTGVIEFQQNVGNNGPFEGLVAIWFTN